MGGRGGTSGLNSGSIADRFRKAGIPFDDTEEINGTAMGKALNGVSDVLTDMGLPLSTVNMISGSDSTGSEIMSVNGFQDLSFSKKYFSTLENAEKSSSNKNDYFVASGIYSTGAHEAGHIIVNEIINRTMTNDTALQKANARTKGTVAKQIIKEAKKSYGSDPHISKYGATKASEKIAEAVSDVYTNKSRANPYSKVIVDVLKRKLRGK